MDKQIHDYHKQYVRGELTTSVSETIRKAPFTQDQSALGKQKKYVLWNSGICLIAENLLKSCFLTQNFIY